MPSDRPLGAEQSGSEWQLVGAGVEKFQLINEFLGYLADRAYSPQTVRAYAFDLLAFARWLLEQRIPLEQIATDVLLRFLTACRTAVRRGTGDNVFSIPDGRNAGFSATAINRRLAAIWPVRVSCYASRI
jgi:site-specific recombinase XerD